MVHVAVDQLILEIDGGIGAVYGRACLFGSIDRIEFLELGKRVYGGRKPCYR